MYMNCFVSPKRSTIAKLKSPKTTTHASSISQWKQIKKDIDSLTGKISHLTQQKEINRLTYFKKQGISGIKNERYVSEGKSTVKKSKAPKKQNSSKTFKQLKTCSTTPSIDYRADKKNKSQKKDRKKKVITKPQYSFFDEINCLRLINQNLIRQKQQLQKKLFFSGLENKSMKKQIEQLLLKSYQGKEQRGSRNLSKTTFERDDCVSIFTKDTKVKKTQQQQNLMSAASISPDKCRKIINLSARPKKKSIKQLQRTFDDLVQKSRVERNKMRKRQIWSEMKQVAQQIKSQKQQ